MPTDRISKELRASIPLKYMRWGFCLIEKLYECLKCTDSVSSLVRIVDSELEIEQKVNGTKGAYYVYIYDSGFFVNVKHMSGHRFIAKEGPWSVYRIPKDRFKGKTLLLILSFSQSGSAFPYICTVNDNIVKCCSCDLLERDNELAMWVASRFKILGDEADLVKLYIDVVPKLAKEILDIVKRSGAKEVYFAGHAERTKEAICTPGFSLLTTMVLTTAQSRMQSLLVKISHVLELAVAAKIIDAMDGALIGDEWWVEFTWNRPLTIVKSRVTGKEYTIFFQPTIRSHMIRLIEPSAPKHVVPDVVVFEGRQEKVDIGGLHKLIEPGIRPVLAVEVKTGLQLVKWERSDYIVNQLRAYMKQLKSRNFALVSLKSVDPLLKSQLKSLGIAIFENITSDDVQRVFKSYVLRAITA